MTPEELYNILLRAYPNLQVGAICEVEKTCRAEGFCINKQGKAVIDFDKIKDEYYHGQIVQTPASVDAVAIGPLRSCFCFVEMKGWSNYISHLDKQRHSVSQTTADYNLSGKLLDSQRLCIALSGDPDLFSSMPIRFLLVTDIDVKTHGIEAFHDWMNTLAGTSSDIYSQCVTNSKQTLDSEIHIDHQYLHCHDFDAVLAML